jgi:hypothetical protein
MRPDDKVKHQLDVVVGERFDPPRDLRASALKWIGAAILGVGAAATVMGILDRYLTRAQTAPPPARPVAVQIIPGK